MKSTLEWIAVIVLAIAGFAVLAWEAPGRAPFPENVLIPSRSTLQQRAEQTVRSFGYEAGGWHPLISASRRLNLRFPFTFGIVDRAWRLRTPEAFNFEFIGPERERCMVTLDTTGNLVAFRHIPVEGRRQMNLALSEGGEQRARTLALETFASRVRAPFSSARGADIGFQLSADAVAEESGYAFEWTSAPDPAGLLAWRVSMLVRDDRVLRFEVAPLVLEPLEQRFREATGVYEPLVLSLVALGFAAIVGAAVLALVNLLRGRLPWPFVARVVSLMVVLQLFDIATGSGNFSFWRAWFEGVQPLMGFVLQSLIAVGVACALVAAGRSVRSSADFRRWLGLEDFIRLNWGKASVVRSFWVSGLIACIWAGISFAVALIVPTSVTKPITLEPLTQSAPILAGMFDVRTFSILLVTMFALPFLKARISKWLLRAVLALLVSSAACIFAAVVSLPLSSALLESFLLGLLLVYSYWRFGVLAATLGPLLADPLARAVILFARGELEPQAWGLGFLASAFLFLAVALFLDHRNPNRAEEQRLSEEEYAALKRESERQLLSRRETLLGEFALAQRAQQRMLPARPPVIPGFEVSSVCLPAQQVGGDLFDYIRLSDARIALCVADVAGKGVSASLYMTMVKGLLNALRLERADLLDFVTALNQRVYEVMRRRSFVTMMIAALDAPSRTLELLRAGHLPLLHVGADGHQTFVRPHGMALGLAPSGIFCRSLDTVRLKLKPGDVAVLYSDGVTEAMNPRREEFGEERLADAVAASVSYPAAEIRTRLLSTVRDFQAGAPAHDDITVVVLKATASTRDRREAAM